MRPLLHILLISLGVSASISGALLMAYPDGSAFQAPLTLLARTPFRDFFWPGLILCGLFGVGGPIASMAIVRGWPLGFRFAQVIGGGHVIWILFQVYWFPELSILQPILAAIGLAIVLVAERCRRMVNIR